jgi:hypothetical protein
MAQTRYTEIGCRNDLWWVSFTDWSTRQGGSLSGLTKEQALKLARRFEDGCPYRFDEQIGIVLILE